MIASYVEQAVFAGREIHARVREIGHGATAVGDGAQTLGRLSAGLPEAAESVHQRAHYFVEAVDAARLRMFEQRSEEHPSYLPSIMLHSYSLFHLKKKNQK